MSPLFCVNAVFPAFVLFALGAANLFSRKERSIHVRLAALGMCSACAIACYEAVPLGFVRLSDLWVCVTAFFGWMTGLLYLSFLIEMTSVRRSALFPVAYVLPFALAIASAAVPRPFGLAALAAVGVAVCSWLTLRFMMAWIRAATDERARRDGEWTLLAFVTFGCAIVVSFFYGISGALWIVALWFAVIHIVVNFLNIFSQLTNLENQLIIDNVFDLVMILDAQGRVVRMNRRGYQLTGFSPNAVNGNGVECVVIHGELSARTRREWLERHAWRPTGSGSGRTPSIDAFVATISCEEIPIDLRVILLANLERATTGYIVSATDLRITRQLIKEISDREYATRDLALSESKFSRMFVFNPTGILIVDLDGFTVTDANPAIEELLDRESSSLVGMRLADVGFEMEEIPFDAFIERMRVDGSVPEFDASVRVGSGETKKCRLSAVSFDLNRRRRMLLSVADVTAQEQLREALTRKQKVETIGILAGGIAHDFNNILAVILGHIGLAKMRVIDQHARAPIEKAEEACLRARGMTRQLLAFSRGGKPVIGVCDTRELITESAMLAVNDSAVACLFDVAKDVWPLRVDRIQVGQVISNLVGNAVDAMEKSGIITLRAKNRDLSVAPPKSRPLDLDSKPLAPGRYVEIQIQDQGPGIPESIRAKIFDPFFTTKGKGTGLGLSIVYSVIQNHSAAVRLDSVMGEGTTFFLYLPADSPESLDAPADAEPVSDGRKRVLLMDDDPLVQDSAGAILSSLGYEVVVTSDGKEAVERFREVHDSGDAFDFCVLDLIVPGGMSGADCARELLAIDKDAILLVSSGYSDDLVLSHYRDYGFRGIIPKPYTVEELRQALVSALDF
jgi:PAS domain S-box-containing protein